MMVAPVLIGCAPTGLLKEPAPAQVRQTPSTTTIDVAETVTLNGQPQAIQIRGEDLTNPVLLFIHGGPGTTEMPLAHLYQRPLEAYFTVVQWDQRGAGRSGLLAEAAGLHPEISLEAIVADAASLVDRLRTRFGQQGVVVVGHSWGAVVGVRLARRRPEVVSAYVGIGQLVATRENEALGYAALLAEARRRGDADASRALEALSPYPGEVITPTAIAIQRRYLRAYGGMWAVPEQQRMATAARAQSTVYTPDERARIALGHGERASVEALLPALSDLDLRTLDRRFDCPVFILAGRADLATSYLLARDYFERIEAPFKRFITFERSAHMVQFEEPARFSDVMIHEVRPVVLARHTGAGL